jgi:hypothetical protein
MVHAAALHAEAEGRRIDVGGGGNGALAHC